MKTRNIFLLLAVMFVANLLILNISCEKKEEVSKAKVVGCHEIEYEGYTFWETGCKVGVLSYDAYFPRTGHSFHITCSGDCVSSATIKE